VEAVKVWHGALLGLVAIAWLALASWDRLVSRDDVRFVEEAQAALATGNAYRSHLAKLKTIQTTRTVVMTRWRTIADTATSDSVELDARTHEAAECQVALLACSERALIAEARVAELEPLLTRGLKIVDCRILGLRFAPRCPSRVVTFVVGVGLGVTGALVVR
jgi:hypothetical protein